MKNQDVLNAIAEAHRRKKTETPTQAVARASAMIAALNDSALQGALAAFEPLKRAGAIVSLAGTPVTAAALDRVEARLGHRLPPTYRVFMTSFGGARFMRGNPDEAAHVMTLAQSQRMMKRLMPRFATTFANAQLKKPGPWVVREERAPTRTESGAMTLWPICPYEDGAFSLALGVDSPDHTPILCWNPGYQPMLMTCYGFSMNQWFSEMVDWSLLEITQWLALPERARPPVSKGPARTRRTSS